MHKYDHYAEHIDGDQLKEEQVDDIVCCALEKIKAIDEEDYEAIMMKIHCIAYGPHFDEYDWYYLMNMLHSDYSHLWGEDVAQYVKFAKAYINDPDAGAGKVFYLWRAGKHHYQ